MVGGCFRLRPYTSPCIDAGSNVLVYGSTDFDGNVRIAGACVDIGAYEFPSMPAGTDSNGDGIHDWWEWQYYGQTNGADAGADDDGDNLDNLGEYQQHTNPHNSDTDNDRMTDGNEITAGTCPTNNASFLGMTLPIIPASGSGRMVTWLSVTNRSYVLERSTNSSSPSLFFHPIETNISGCLNTTSYTDTTAGASALSIYRIVVE